MSMLNKMHAPNWKRLTEVLPYQVYDEEERIYVNDSSYGFVLEVTPLCGASKEIVDVLTGMITDGVPQGCAIQVINWASPKVGEVFDRWVSPRTKVGGIYERIASKREEYFKTAHWESVLKNPYLIRDFKLYISVSIPFKHGQKGYKSLVALKSQLKTTLQSAGMESSEVEPKELLQVLEELTNPNSKAHSSKLEWDREESLKSQLSNSEVTMYVEPQGLVFESVGESKKEVRCYTIRNFPEIWGQWNNQDLLGDYYSDYLRMPCPFLTIFSFVYGDEDKETSKAIMKSVRATQKTASGIARFMPSVIDIDRDWKFVVEKLKSGQKLVKAFYQVVIYADQSEIETCDSAIRSIYKTKGWNLQLERYVQLQSWLAVFPFTFSEGLASDLERLGRFKTMVTWSCANLAPLQGEWKGMRDPKMMLFGRRGQPFFWNPFSNNSGNYNVAVVGKSGSGKSVFMQEMVASLVGSNGQVIVIDDGRSFMNSCYLQKGKFVEFGGASTICLNPFSIVSETMFEKNPDYKEEVIHLLNLIIRQMCRVSSESSDIENAFIAESINAVWGEKKRKATVTDVANYLLSNPDARAKDLGMMLLPFGQSGIYSRFFEGEANIELDSSLFVFEFDKIKSKPDLQRIVLMVVIFLVSEKMFHGNRKRTISLVIDEAWSLLHGNQFADFIEGIARRARKYNGNIITGTQNIDDYYKNPAATAAIQNTDWFCLLSQNKESIEAMKKSGRISLTPDMEKALGSLRTVSNQYSEVMIYGSGFGWTIGRLILDPFSVALYSSKGEDFARINSYIEQGYSLEDAVEMVAEKIGENR